MRRTPLFIVLTLGCTDVAPPNHAPDAAIAPPGHHWVQIEEAARRRFASSRIAVRGQVIDSTGRPVAGAEVRLAGDVGRTGPEGRFDFGPLPRANATLVVDADGHRRERVPLHLHRPLDVQTLVVAPIILAPEAVTRTLFGGDVQLGRRFLDPDGLTPRDALPADHPEALIRPSTALPDTLALFDQIEPWLAEPDFTALNLESVITDDPATPDQDNRFVFFTLPDSARALSMVGIDYLSLANNHMYDYFDGGLADTLEHLRALEMPHSGAGLDADAAFVPSRHAVRDHRFSMLSLVSIEGVPFRNSTGATDERSGTADLNNDARIQAVLDAERAADHLPIATVHTGYEYMEQPPDDDYTTRRLEFLAETGARLVVGHHPHIAQGFEWHAGVPIAHSLGNFIFDQDRLGTLFGLTLEVDWLEGDIHGLRGRGHYIEGYRPRPVTGVRHDRFLRRIAESSQPWGTITAPYNGAIHVYPDATHARVESRPISVVVTIDDTGYGLADLRGVLAEGESVAFAQGDGLQGRLGRDLLLFGDMEDMDVDDEVMEVSRWYYSGYADFVSTFRCQHDTHRGAVALCAVRRDRDETVAVIPFRNRVRVLGDKHNLPNKALTLLAWISRDNAGPVSVEATWHASFGGLDFGGATLARLPAGTHDWQPVVADLPMPPDSPAFPRDPANPYDPALRINNPRSFKIAFHHAAPPSGEGILRVDDVAVITWRDHLDLSAGAAIPTPHAHDFIRVGGPPGTHTVRLTLERWVPAFVPR